MSREIFFSDVKNIVMLILIGKIQEKLERGDGAELGRGEVAHAAGNRKLGHLPLACGR